MTRYLLLQVEDIFQLSNNILVAIPDFPPVSLPKMGELNAWVRTPEGVELPCSILLKRAHYNSPKTDHANRRWRLVPVLQGITKGQIPIGSALMIEEAAVAMALDLPILENYGPDDERRPDSELSHPAEADDVHLVPEEPPRPQSPVNPSAKNEPPIQAPKTVAAHDLEPSKGPGLNAEESGGAALLTAAKEPSLIKRLDQAGDLRDEIAAREPSLIKRLDQAVDGDTPITTKESSLVRRLDQAVADVSHSEGEIETGAETAAPMEQLSFDTAHDRDRPDKFAMPNETCNADVSLIAAEECSSAEAPDRAQQETADPQDEVETQGEVEPPDLEPRTGQASLIPHNASELEKTTPRLEGKSPADRIAVLAWVGGALICFWMMIDIAVIANIAPIPDPARDFTERLVPSVAFGMVGIFMVLMGIRQWLRA